MELKGVEGVKRHRRVWGGWFGWIVQSHSTGLLLCVHEHRHPRGDQDLPRQEQTTGTKPQQQKKVYHHFRFHASRRSSTPHST